VSLMRTAVQSGRPLPTELLQIVDGLEDCITYHGELANLLVALLSCKCWMFRVTTVTDRHRTRVSCWNGWGSLLG
jgi:hypothetical protein